MSDKLISLESVLKEIRRFKGYIDDDMIERFSIAFKRLPSVELPMSAVEYEKVKDRMRQSNDNAYGLYVRALFEGQIDEAVAIVEKWVKEHPEKKHKTYAEDFKQKFPNHLHNCGMPIVCRNEVYGFGGRCTVEEAVKRGGCSSCWNAEMEGEE